MKTLVLPVLNDRKVLCLDLEHVRSYWADMLLETGTWAGAMTQALMQLRRQSSNEIHPSFHGWILACAVTYKGEIEHLRLRKSWETSTPPLTGLRPEAARSAAPA